VKSFDVGLSLILAPHPGVVHFEMAAAGIVVVTNVYENRTAESLAGFSSNIIAVEPQIHAIARGLAIAAQRCTDVDARLAGARQLPPEDWPNVYAKHLGHLTEALGADDWPAVQQP
jgi:hypothetical protein